MQVDSKIQAGYLNSPYFKDVYVHLVQNKLPSHNTAIGRTETLVEIYLLLDFLLFRIITTSGKESTVIAMSESSVDRIITLNHFNCYQMYLVIMKHFSPRFNTFSQTSY